ncbi:MAG: hypothetical protein LCH85_00190 [Chloroflexi bacterium]|nr:hypothetical protein [Chloroflexota bacterium]
MTTIDDGLIVYLQLDALSAGQTVLDISGNNNNAVAHGLVQLVSDDVFGSVLDFDGSSYLELNPASIPAGNAITVSFWACGAENLPGAGVSAIAALTAADERSLNVHLPWSDGQVYFDCGAEGNTWDRMNQAANASDYKGTWTYWAFTKDVATGTMQIYANGTLWAQATGKTLPIKAASQATFGAYSPNTTPYYGKLSSLRIYNRALSGDEILQVMAADPAAAATFDSLYPVGFNLLDDDGHSILYIDDNPQGYNLFLTISNNSPRTINLVAPSDQTPSASNHHFVLNFRPGTLSTATLSQVKLTDQTWKLSTGQAVDGTTSLYLLSTQARSLTPNQSLNLALQSISASASSGARNTRVELSYQQLQYANSLTPLIGSRLQNLVVLNAQGAHTPPLHVGFVGPNMVLNNGSAANQLTLHITNLLDDAALALSPSTSNSPTTFIVAFDSQDNQNHRDWALGTTSQVNAIAITLEGWTGGKAPEAAEWIFTTTQTSLAAEAFIQMNLSNIISSLPSGAANLYLLYENLPGYRDGYFVVSIDKTPLIVTNNQRVGVGTNTPTRALAVRGIASSEELVSFEDVNGATKWHFNQKWGGKAGFNIAETGVKDGRLFLQAGGNTGIGTTAPRTGLDTGTGVLSGAANDYTKAQFAFTGGGRVTWNGINNRLKWSQRFIAISMERSISFASGHVNVNQPTSDIPADQVYDNQVRSCNAEGIVLKAWEALYAVHTVGGNENAVSYQITCYTKASFFVPSNWLLVAVVNGDDGTIRLANGLVLNPGASSLNGSPIPSGTINMWSGADNALPGGWVLCNGQNGTPDLRNRFVVGAGATYAVGTTGGSDAVTLTTDQMPRHNHSGSTNVTGDHNHWMEGTDADGLSKRRRRIWGDTTVDMGFGGGRNADPNDERWRGSVNTDTTGNHSHSLVINENGGNQAHENRPPFYALCYIMKQ